MPEASAARSNGFSAMTPYRISASLRYRVGKCPHHHERWRVSAADLVEALQQLVGRQLDLFVAPFRGAKLAGDQTGAMHAPKVAVDESIARLRGVGRTFG